MQLHHQQQPSSLSATSLSVKVAKSASSAPSQHYCQPLNPLSSTSIPTMSGRIINFSSPLFINRSFVCSSVLLSIVAWSVTILLISSCLDVVDADAMGHSLGKRSYLELGCKGVYDKSIFARLDRVCEDCYNLFREPQLHTLCRKDCFTTYYFKGCVETLLMQDEIEQFKMAIKQLHGADPGV